MFSNLFLIVCDIFTRLDRQMSFPFLFTDYTSSSYSKYKKIFKVYFYRYYKFKIR